MKIEEKRHGETARQYVHRILRENTVSLGLELRTPFNNVRMLQMIDTNCTPVWEAVIQPNKKSGIIGVFPQKGVCIALTDMGLVEEVRFLCLVLEKAAVEPAYGQADEEDLQWPDENIRLQEFYLEGGLSRRLLELDNEMHRKLFPIYRKELTYEMSQRLAIHYDRVRSPFVATVKDRKITEGHKKLLEVIWSRDKKLAAETMGLHLNRQILNGRMLRDQYLVYFK